MRVSAKLIIVGLDQTRRSLLARQLKLGAIVLRGCSRSEDQWKTMAST